MPNALITAVRVATQVNRLTVALGSTIFIIAGIMQLLRNRYPMKYIHQKVISTRPRL